MKNNTFKYVLSLVIITYGQTVVYAQENSNSASNKQLKVTFNPPERRKPRSSAGGASRSIGECINSAENTPLPLTPLVPNSAAGLTVASHPTVLAYVPKTNVDRGFFSWQDQEGNHHYQTIVPINNKTRIISLTLPDKAPPLEVGKVYQWSLALMCNGILRPDSPTLQGDIERIAMDEDLKSGVNNTNKLQDAVIYAQEGIWYETVAILAQLHKSEPLNADLLANWQELLTSVGLEKFSSTPLSKVQEKLLEPKSSK